MPKAFHPLKLKTASEERREERLFYPMYFSGGYSQSQQQQMIEDQVRSKLEPKGVDMADVNLNFMNGGVEVDSPKPEVREKIKKVLKGGFSY